MMMMMMTMMMMMMMVTMIRYVLCLGHQLCENNDMADSLGLTGQLE